MIRSNSLLQSCWSMCVTRGAFLQCRAEKYPLPSRPWLQTLTARQVIGKDRKTKCDACCQEAAISVQRTRQQQWKPTLIQSHPNSNANNRKLCFASTHPPSPPKKQLKSWTCCRLPQAPLHSICLGEELGSRTYRPVLKTIPCNGTNLSKLS